MTTLARGLCGVPPYAPYGDVPNRCMANTKVASDLSLRHSLLEKKANRAYFGKCQASIPVLLARWTDAPVPSSPLNHLASIPPGVTERKVRRIHAARVIATVQDIGVIWNRAIEEFVREPMRVDIGFARLTPKQPAVGVAFSRRFERPTLGIGVNLNVRKEAILVCAEHGGSYHRARSN